MGKPSLSNIFLLIWICDVRSQEWSADIPVSLTALPGLCIVIPCRFTYPGPRVPAASLIGIWYQGLFERLVYHSKEPGKVDPRFQSRTSLVRSVEDNDCTLRIDHMSKEDSHSYMFRIEVEDRNKYTYKDKTVTINVTDSAPAPSMHCPGVLTEGVAVNITCLSVSPCPDAAPYLFWNNIQAQRLKPQSSETGFATGAWRQTALLHLVPSSGNHGEVLQCSAAFPNGLRSSGPECRLVVNYAPKNVTVEILSPMGPIIEGDGVILSCQSKSHPLPHSISWFRRLGGQDEVLADQGGQELSLDNVSRDLGLVWCQVENSVGKSHSLPITLDVLYKPEIKEGSSCSLHTQLLKCVCVATGNPIPSIHWKYSHTEDRIQGNTSSSHSGSEANVTLTTLNLNTNSRDSTIISCVAENILATASKSFQFNHSDIPKNVTVEILSPMGPIIEGDGVILSCQSKSHPLPHSISWFRRLGGQDEVLADQGGQELSLDNVSRDLGLVWCQVENSVGKSHSLPITLDVLYKPEIKEGSSCSLHTQLLKCVCVATGNPIPSIHWKYSHTEDRIQGNTSSLHSGSEVNVTLTTLNLNTNSTDSTIISCVAENILATASKSFQFNHSESSIDPPGPAPLSGGHNVWVVCGALIGVGVLMFLLLGIIFFKGHSSMLHLSSVGTEVCALTEIRFEKLPASP